MSGGLPSPPCPSSSQLRLLPTFHVSRRGPMLNPMRSSMVIDYIFVGSVGCKTGSTGSAFATAPVALVPESDTAAAADPKQGIRSAVLRWGSDHLPVACDVHVELSHKEARSESRGADSAQAVPGGSIALATAFALAAGAAFLLSLRRGQSVRA